MLHSLILKDCKCCRRKALQLIDYCTNENIQDTHYEYGYTGDGVSIGMLEGFGEPDLQKAQFIGADITLDTTFLTDPQTQQPNITTHATRVASIICSQGSQNCGIGIAPDSSVYCTYLMYDSDDEINIADDEINISERIHSRIAWLIDKGVKIINVSCTLNTHNVYGDFDNYIDKITKENSVVFVVASGNDGTDGVNSPGLAYNAITVGNINDNNTLGISDDSLRPKSSYTNLLYLFHIPSKPDLCAYGTNIDVNGANDSGTSFSAPHVSGALALLIEQEWMLTYSPAVLKAIVTAGVHIGKHHYVPENRVVTTQNDNPESSYIQYGAGILNCLNNADIVDNCNYSFGYFGASSIGTTTIFLVANRIFRYAFVYRHPYDATDFQNIDIFLLDPSGNTVASSQTTTNNLEIIEYTPTVAGTYTIKIQHTGVTNYATYIGEAWIQH